MPISLSGSLLLTGSLTATSTITAQKLVVQVITSSIVNFTGSNTFGSSTANIQEMTGSLRVTGSGAHYILGGNVGIGTTTPDNTYQGLTIFGTNPSLRLKTSSPSGWNWIECVNSSGVNNVSFGVNQTSTYFGVNMGAGMDNPEFIIISGSNNVGIGTASPFSSLDVSTTSTGAICVGNSSGTISSGDLIGAISFVSRDVSTYSSGGVANIRSYATATYNTSLVSADLRFYTTNGVQNTAADVLFGEERMRITSAGSVGIGMSNPNYRLGINSSGINSYLQFTSATTGTGSADGFIVGSGDAGAAVLLNRENTDMVFYTNNTERMTISGSGNVGIGVTSPSYRLHVTESIYVTSGLTSTMFTARSNNGTGTSINFASSSPLGNTDNYTITHKMVHGTGYGYEISHDATTRYIRMVAGSGGVELLGTATAWTAVSDIRKKDILQTGIPNALEKIGGIDAIFYKYKNEELLAPGEVMPEMVEENKPTKIKQRRVGLVAQQVLSALPEAVNYSETEDVYKLSYTEVIPLMIEAIKELKADNTALKSRIEQLESKTQ